MASLDDIPTLPPTTPTSDDLIAVIDGSDRRSPKRVSLDQLGPLIGGSVTASSIDTALQTATAAQAESIRNSLTPNRVLFVSDLAANWFNGSKNDSIGAIHIPSSEATVGTKVRVRGVCKVHFQGASPAFGGDAVVCLTFNGDANATSSFEGVALVVNGGSSSIFEIDLELDFKAGTSGKFKLGLGANTPSYVATAARSGGIFERWGSEAESSLFVVDPAVEQSVGAACDILIQLQAAGGTTNQSVCNFLLDVSYEIS